MKKKYVFLFSLLLSAIASLSQSTNAGAYILSHTDVCSPGDCTSLEVTYANVKETTSYQVSSIPFNPPFGYTNGNQTNLSVDDRWSGVIDLKGSNPQNFNFCFYGQTYDKVLISTNGAITFSLSGIVPGGMYSPNSFSNWVLSGPMPYISGVDQAPFRNSINGVFQDINPNVINAIANPNINYYTIGTYPNRAFVVNFSNVAQYGNPCSSDITVGAQTSQMVLWETTNIIDIYVQRRVPCTTWASGNGLIGIQNQEGTLASVPPGRNGGTWSATNEAWRFTPNGNSIVPVVTWTKNGVFYSNNNPVDVCPTGLEQYAVTVSYPICNSSNTSNYTDSESVNFVPQLQNPNDLQACSSVSGGSAIFDLTSNNSVVLGAINPADYLISYHTSASDTELGTNSIINPQAYSSLGNQTIYLRAEGVFVNCLYVKDFDLNINPNPSAPTGVIDQSYTNGETVANIEVVGTNIKWYGSATGNDLLPNSTLLVDGATYYASQTNSAGCESRTNPSRLAVTVHLTVLNNQDFNMSDLNAYPNPVKDILNLSYSTEISSVEVYNMLGQKVMFKTLNVAQGQIDMSNLNSGNYIVKVTADGLTKTIKVIKE
ncbi:MAG TPA: T9SS type A sorting domain-containing protein [Flavobacterium sp.]|uniref:T9SS type A sorting domain-containing protein n=1 Tax=Flavobacterium sp. TaxID=239 RepID=UPI002B962E30|nr:T9SS type A sorting domain-containing protein [Flavobacterium sp.]HSD13704.1 T9SS type A sorting domain-containing protein [Flavobacterium sp.]